MYTNSIYASSEHNWMYTQENSQVSDTSTTFNVKYICLVQYSSRDYNDAFKTVKYVFQSKMKALK